MPEYYITGRTPAAPFVSEEFDIYEQAQTPQAALLAVVDRDPGRVYAAEAWASHRAYKSVKVEPLARWICNKERVLQEMSEGKSGYSVYTDRDKKGMFVEVDNERRYVPNPFEGALV